MLIFYVKCYQNKDEEDSLPSVGKHNSSCLSFQRVSFLAFQKHYHEFQIHFFSWNTCFFSVTMLWHSLLETTTLTKRCFMSFMPFSWLSRHINTNYTNRLSFPKPPGSKLQLSLTVLIGVLGVCICVCVWSYVCGMHTCWNLLLIFCKSKWGEKAIKTYCETLTVFSLSFSLYPWVIRYTTPGGSWVPLLQQLYSKKCFWPECWKILMFVWKCNSQLNYFRASSLLGFL